MEEIDRISQLPEDVLIRILSLVPIKEVGRAKLVSKSWQNLFEFLPSFTFEFLLPRSPPHEDSIDDDMSSFINAIDSALKPHKRFTLDRLRLNLDLDLIGLGSGSRSLIDMWIDAALERKVRQLDLCFQCHNAGYYFLPSEVFGARTITDLRLEECRFEICGDIDLPALRKLCLRRIRCEDQAIQKLISSCPLIQDLKTSFCGGMQRLHVSELVNLQRLSVICCYALESIEIDAPTLQYLEYHHGSLQCDLLLITPCEFLRELILYDRFLTEDLFQNLLSGFPNLELLKMNDTRLKWIEISHRRLKQLDLTLTNLEAEGTLKIDTPNLRSLIYYGCRMPLISVISSLNTSSLQEVDINFINSDDYGHFSILQSKEFFEMMKHCQDIKLNLHIKSNQELIIPKRLRPILSPPVYDIKHLHLLVYNCSRYQLIIDRMFWMCHPQILSFSRGTKPGFLKVLYNKFRNKEERHKCCISCTTKCWQHYLEDVQIDGDESRAEIDRIISATELSNIVMKCEVRIKLKWRS